MLTLTGSPGIGKTRLAIQIVEKIAGSFPDGVYFVPLATLKTSNMVIPTIAHDLGLREIASEPLQKRLENYLRDKQTLLFIDNFEQVAAAAPAIAELLAAAPLLKVLVTSRSLLRLYGEHEFRVPPLLVPGAEGRSNLKALSRSQSVILFLQRARAVNASFMLTQSNVEAIAELCSHLEGIPLAIELAAARIRVVSPQAMLTRLHSRLDLLRSSATDLPVRQRSIRNALEWSYELLSSAQQRLFRCLSVFESGFTVESAQRICCPENDDTGYRYGIDTLERDIEALTYQSLVSQIVHVDMQTRQGDEGPRFSMLETVREFAFECMASCGETCSIKERHALFFAQVAEQARMEIGGPLHEAALDRLEREYQNLYAALDWCAEGDGHEHAHEHGDTAVGLRIATALVPFWQLRGSPREGKAWLSLFMGRIAASSLSQTELETLLSLGQFTSNQDEHKEAREIFERTLALSRQRDYIYGIGLSLTALGHQAIHLGEPDLAEAYYLECLALCLRFGNKQHYISTLLNLGDLACHNKAYPHAMELFEEALDLARQSGLKIMIAASLNKLGYLQAESGDPGKALSMATEALELFRDGANRSGVAYCLGLHGKISYTSGNMRRAAVIFGAARKLCDSLGLRLEPMLHTDPNEYEKIVASVQEILGNESFVVAWQKGLRMTTGEAIKMVTATANKSRKPVYQGQVAYSDGLTEREVEVLRLVSEGLTNAQVANRLVVSPYTVNMHLRSIYSKLGVPSRSAATRYAIENRLV